MMSIKVAEHPGTLQDILSTKKGNPLVSEKYTTKEGDTERDTAREWLANPKKKLITIETQKGHVKKLRGLPKGWKYYTVYADEFKDPWAYDPKKKSKTVSIVVRGGLPDPYHLPPGYDWNAIDKEAGSLKNPLASEKYTSKEGDAETTTERKWKENPSSYATLPKVKGLKPALTNLSKAMKKHSRIGGASPIAVSEICNKIGTKQFSPKKPLRFMRTLDMKPTGTITKALNKLNKTIKDNKTSGKRISRIRDFWEESWLLGTLATNPSPKMNIDIEDYEIRTPFGERRSTRKYKEKPETTYLKSIKAKQIIKSKPDTNPRKKKTYTAKTVKEAELFAKDLQNFNYGAVTRLGKTVTWQEKPRKNLPVPPWSMLDKLALLHHGMKYSKLGGHEAGAIERMARHAMAKKNSSKNSGRYYSDVYKTKKDFDENIGMPWDSYRTIKDAEKAIPKLLKKYYAVALVDSKMQEEKFFRVQGSRSNTIRSNPWSRGSKVQSVIFKRSKWTAPRAKKWLKGHKFKAPNVDATKTELRFRQLEPTEMVKEHYGSIPFGVGTGIRALVAEPGAGVAMNPKDKLRVKSQESRVKPKKNLKLSKKDKDIIKKINEALKRMESKGHKNTIYYENLKSKRDAIKSGLKYSVKDMTKEVISGVADYSKWVKKPKPNPLKSEKYSTKTPTETKAVERQWHTKANPRSKNTIKYDISQFINMAESLFISKKYAKALERLNLAKGLMYALLPDEVEDAMKKNIRDLENRFDKQGINITQIGKKNPKKMEISDAALKWGNKILDKWYSKLSNIYKKEPDYIKLAREIVRGRELKFPKAKPSTNAPKGKGKNYEIDEAMLGDAWDSAKDDIHRFAKILSDELKAPVTVRGYNDASGDKIPDKIWRTALNKYIRVIEKSQKPSTNVPKKSRQAKSHKCPKCKAIMKDQGMNDTNIGKRKVFKCPKCNKLYANK